MVLLATREDIDATLSDQRQPNKPTYLPHCYASDLKLPQSHKESMQSEHSRIWKTSTGREFYGFAGYVVVWSRCGNQWTAESMTCGFLTGRSMSTVGSQNLRRDLYS